MKPGPISSPSDGSVMPSAIDLIGRNPALQEHWIRRFFAGLIDGIVVAAIYLLFALPLAFLGLVWYVVPFLYGVVWLVYSMLLQTLFSATIGKRLLKLRSEEHTSELQSPC